MSRFSPQHRVQDQSGQILADAISRTFDQFTQRKRMQQQDAEREQEQQRQVEGQDLALALQGIQRGAAPMEGLTPRPVMQNGTIAGVEAGPKRFEQLTPGFYRDTQVIQRQQEQQRQTALADALMKARIPMLADPEGRAADLAYKSALTDQARAVAQGQSQRAEAPVKLDSVTTEQGVFMVNPHTGEPVRRLGDRPRPAGAAQGQAKAPSEGERRAAALLTVANNAYQTLSTAEPPSRVESGMARLGMNEGLSAQRQKVNQAARQFITSYLYVVSGATASPQEVDNLTKQIEPLPGDSPEVVQQKREAQATMLYAMQQMGGRAAEPVAPRPPDRTAPAPTGAGGLLSPAPVNPYRRNR